MGIKTFISIFLGTYFFFLQDEIIDLDTYFFFKKKDEPEIPDDAIKHVHGKTYYELRDQGFRNANSLERF